MKHKIGDKVKIKSKEWWNAQPKNCNGFVECGEICFTMNMTRMCGKTAIIVEIIEDGYCLKDFGYIWNDEMFEDDEPQVSETLLQDIANVIKSHNMGVQVSEQEGKLIIEPLKVEKEDLPVDTPVMTSDDNINFTLRYYAGNGEVFCAGQHDDEIEGTCHYDIIIPWEKFDPKNLGESMKFNIAK